MATPPEPLTSYRQLFATEALDPLNGDFTSVDDFYRTANNLYDEEYLFDRASSTDSDYPACYLFSRYTGSHYVYEVVHSVSLFPALHGREVVWENKVYATLGDVINRSMVTSVEFPVNAFEIVKQGAAHTVPKDLQQAIDWYNDLGPDEEFLGPCADGAPNTKEASTRQYFPLPHQYVNMFLGQSTKVRQGFVDMAAVMIQRGDEARYPNLVNWLLMSITRKTQGSPTWVTVPMPSPPELDTDGTFHRTRDKLLKRHLPGLQVSATPALAVTNQQIVDNLSSIAENQERSLQAQLDQQARSTAPKTVEKAFGAVATKELLRLCNVEAVPDLPALWNELAANGKAAYRKVLDVRLRDTASGLGRASYIPQATPAMKDKVLNLDWGGANKEDLGLGLNPFNLVLRSYISNASVSDEAREQCNLYDTIMAGTAPSLADTKALKADSIILPNNMYDAKAQLYAMMILFITLVGSEHPFVQAYGRFLTLFDMHERSLMDAFQRYNEPDPILWVLLRHVQIKTHLYWEQARQLPTLPAPPDFASVIQLINEENKSWCPRMPMKYWPKAKTGPLSLPGLVWPGGGSVMSGLTSEETTTTDGSGGGTPKNPQTTGTMEQNPNPSEKLIPFRGALKKLTLQGVIRDPTLGPPPFTKVNGQNVQLCASYHVRGSCYSNCNRHALHRPLQQK